MIHFRVAWTNKGRPRYLASGNKPPSPPATSILNKSRNSWNGFIGRRVLIGRRR